MIVESLWNDLPWPYDVFQVEKVYTCINIGKFFGLSIVSNHSETVEKAILDSGAF
jgi:hypothetical protein